MKGFFLLLGLLNSALAFSQERDTFQPDSVYRVNQVKTRIRINEKAQTKSKLIYHYDRQGRWIEFILTDNFDEDKIQMKVEYKYDETGRLTRETETLYYGNKVFIRQSKLEHDSKGRVVKKTKEVNGQLYSVETYSYDPLVEFEQEYRDGKIYREQTAYYEFPNYSTRFTGHELPDLNAKPQKFRMPNGKVAKFTPPKEEQKWDYIFENKLDDKGRILERKRFEDGQLQDDITYKYNDQGLLIEKYEKILSVNIETKEVFEYTYWDH